MYKALLGYVIEDGVTPDEYEHWLWNVHAPDLLANPHLDRIVFNKVLYPVTSTSGGASDVPESIDLYRVAEMHYADEAAYEAYKKWWTDHPIPPERGPGGRTAFRFYVIAESQVASRENITPTTWK